MSAHDWAKECAKHFDVAALFDALDVQRRDRGPELARRCQRTVGFARNAQRLLVLNCQFGWLRGRSGTL